MFGGTSSDTLQKWFNLVLEYTYINSPILRRSRNLSNPNHMRAVLEELHAATLRNTRATASFTPTMLEVQRLNPHLGSLKLVVVVCDSRHIKCHHSICFFFQRRTYSTKIGNNAVVKLVACGLDGKQKFIYLTAASISPSNTDEAVCSFLLDMETNQGDYITIS